MTCIVKSPFMKQTDFTKAELSLGIDEAGRGPVLGPMVYACAYWDKNMEKDIESHFGFADSKKLSSETRENMYNSINEYSYLIKYEKIVFSPEELSFKMLERQKISLNKISQSAAADLIRKVLDKGYNLKNVFVDTVGPPKQYQELLKSKFPHLNITVEAKADAKYPTVSTASIVAKVTRDKIVEKWEYKEKGESFSTNTGSGYPSDPYTTQWLKENYNEVFGYPSFARFSWKTISNIFKENKDTCAWENYNEEEEEQKWKKYGGKDSKQGSLVLPKVEEDENMHKNFYNLNNLDFDVDL